MGRCGPIREELFGADRLEQHAENLGRGRLRRGQTTQRSTPSTTALRKTRGSCSRPTGASAADVASGQGVVPAAEWLLDNYHIVEKQVREIQTDLPRGYYRQLPKLAAGPFVGYPRVFGIAWAFVAHTDSNFEPESLERFVAATNASSR